MPDEFTDRSTTQLRRDTEMKRLIFVALILAALPLLYTARGLTTDTIEFPVTDESLIGVRKPDGKMGYFFMVDGQLTSSEVAQNKCEAKLHACFQATKAEMESLLGAIAGPRDCDNLCGGISSRACSNQACIDRCLVASGNSGSTSCQ
jgi:hypothetical protein